MNLKGVRTLAVVMIASASTALILLIFGAFNPQPQASDQSFLYENVQPAFVLESERHGGISVKQVNGLGPAMIQMHERITKLEAHDHVHTP